MLTTKGGRAKTLTIASGAAVTEALDVSIYTSGIVLMPAAWTAASLGVQVSDREGGTYYPLYTKAAAISEVDGPAVSKAYALPEEAFTASWVKLWSQDGAGADTNQAAARTLKVLLKT